jgi:hypothetical protein
MQRTYTETAFCLLRYYTRTTHGLAQRRRYVCRYLTRTSREIHVNWVPCRMARPQVAERGEGLQIWRVAANILNKQLRTADRGDPPTWGLGRGITTPTVKHYICCEVCTWASEMGGFSGTTRAPEKGYEIWHVEYQEPL